MLAFVLGVVNIFEKYILHETTAYHKQWLFFNEQNFKVFDIINIFWLAGQLPHGKIFLNYNLRYVYELAVLLSIFIILIVGKFY